MTTTSTKAKRDTITVGPAKGRPMLSWVGKRPLRNVTAFPAQEIERFAVDGASSSAVDWSQWPSRYPRSGLLFHGDNKEVLAHLLANGFRGKVDLVYIDPPFDSGADYVRRVALRGPAGTVRLDGQGYTLGEQIQYTDIWANDNYLQFMYERLLLIRELVGTGAVYVHSDARRVHHLRALLDEVFGEDAFRNQIVWRRTSSHGGANRFGAVTDHILFYTRGENTWFPQFQAMSPDHIERHYRHTDPRGRYALGELTAPGLRRGPSGEPWRGFNVSGLGRHWANVPNDLDRLDRDGLIYWPVKSGAWPRLKRYLEDSGGRPITDFWEDLDPINMVGLERESYPTQKPEALLQRIVTASTVRGSLILDCFIGSGTTAAVAQKLGRRWIGCDINKGAIQTTAKRLMEIMEAQAADSSGTLDLDTATRPAQLSFATYRVNDYDLAIQHNEAVNLACEHLGVVRTRADPFFDGTLGPRLVKIVPFDHPITPVDLDDVARELRNRPDEDRDVTVVGLGRELACDPWLADHNRKGAPNQITPVDLRTDPRYGKFFAHQPATASVTMTRDGDSVQIVIEDFISPSIVERLASQDGLVAPRITDWRSMVDSVLIDTSYDGAVFDVALADVPERKDDLVSGRYDVRVGTARVTVALKITDMLGEELLVTREV